MHLRPIEHLENCRPKCTLVFFFTILQLIYKENQPTVFQNLTELEKSIPHIPIIHRIEKKGTTLFSV